MAADQPNPHRDRTDESLRNEREQVDGPLGEYLTALAEDTVVGKARARADHVLAAARARIDRASAASVKDEPGAALKYVDIERERTLADKAVRDERADVDKIRRSERSDVSALLASERKVTDEDLSKERAQADDALTTRDEFMAIVSHDLRNMLGGIVGFAGLIAKGGPQADHGEYARRIQRSGARMGCLIGDLLDVASIDAGMLAVASEPGDATLVVTEAVDAFQAQAGARGVTLTADIVPPLPAASFDAARLLQVLNNLLGNALKFTPSGGRVRVRLECRAGELLFSVIDSGSGIPADKLKLIFGRFQQLGRDDRRGVGLGLYIARSIVQGHGGTMWAESEPGKGTSLHFSVPLAGRA